jgi:hypothetical protein
MKLPKGEKLETQKHPDVFCLIINNMNFDGYPQLKREGSDMDVMSFTQLKYNVLVETDLSAKEIIDVINRAKVQSEGDSFILVSSFILNHNSEYALMSHGNKNGRLYGRDINYITEKQVRKLINNVNCPQLRNKAKIIIWQACRGGII